MAKLWGFVRLAAFCFYLFCFIITVQEVLTQGAQRPGQLPIVMSDSQTPSSPAENLQCDVADNEKVPCGVPGVSAADCAALHCCFSGQQCFYGKMVTVQCTQDGQFVVVVAKDVTLPRLNLDSLSLLGGDHAPCSPVDSNSGFAIFQFPVTACGTTIRVEGGYLVYENTMISSYEVGIGPLGAITRDSHYELLFQCRYSEMSVEAVVMEVKALPPPLPVAASGPLRVELRLGNGQCTKKGCDAGAEAYTSYYNEADYPVTKVLRDPVYVEVRILERTDPNLVLTLSRCWATSASTPFSLPQWDLLVDGCPYHDDRYLTELISVKQSSDLQFPNHYKRFVFKMFTFVDPASMAPMKEKVFIHCSTAICTPSSMDSCVQTCNRKRRDLGSTKDADEETVVSSKEIIVTLPQTFPSNVQ